YAAAARRTVQFEEFLAPINAWLEISIYPSQEGLTICLRDVSERKFADQELRSSEEKFRELFDQALDAVLILDQDRCYVDANPAACRLLGLPRQHLLALALDNFAALSAGRDFDAAWKALLERGQHRGEMHLYLPDGSVREVDFTAK